MFKAIKQNVFVRVPCITSRKFKFFLKKRPHTQSTTDVKSHKLKRERGHGGGFSESVGVGVQGRPCLVPGGTCALGRESSVPSPTPPAIHLPPTQPAAEYDNVSIFHFPDVTINKAMIQKGLC